MDSQIEHQLYQVYSTNAGLIPKLIASLVDTNALPAGLATLLLRQAAETLQHGPAQGEVVDAGVSSLLNTVRAIEVRHPPAS